MLCPCHLPVTLAALVLLAGGTVAGGFVRHNLLLIGTITTLMWAGGTLMGYRLLKAGRQAAWTAQLLDTGPEPVGVHDGATVMQ